MGKWSDAVLLNDLEMAPPERDDPTAVDISKNRVKWSDVFVSDDIGPQDQFIGSKPIGSVLTKFSSQTDSAGFATNLIAGIADDPQTQIKVYAGSRFPDLPEGERLKRYGIHKGEIVYMGDDGNLYRETADTWFNRMSRFAAQTGAHLPSIILGTIGSMAGPGTAALGAAGGEGIRKSVAATTLKEPQTATGNIIDMAKEGTMAAAGDIAGRGLARGINYIGAKRGGQLAKEAGRGRQVINVKETKQIEDLGGRFGVDLYPPQTTGSKRLADKFNLLGDIESSAPIIQAARKKQVEQIDNAVYKFFKKLSPGKVTTSEVGERLSEASRKAIKVPVNIRKAQAAPIYRKAFMESPDFGIVPIKKDLASVFKDSLEGSAENKAFKRLSNMIPEEKMTLKQVDQFKKEIDKILGDPTRDPRFAVDKGVKNKLLQFKEKLLKQADSVSPDYARARKVFGELSEEVNKQSRKTVLGDISKLEGDKVVMATKKLFASQEVKRSPEIVTKIKRLIQKQDPEVWDKAVSSHLQELFESTKLSATGGISNIGGHFYKKVWGDLAQRKVLKAAMSPKQFKNLEDFMTVLARSGMILGKESATATRHMMMEEIGGSGLRSVVRAATRPLVTKEKVIGDRLLESILYKNAKKLADAMTSERAAKQLGRMMQLGTKTEQLLPMITNFLGMVKAGEFFRERQKSKLKDVAPPILKERGRNQLGRLRAQ